MPNGDGPKDEPSALSGFAESAHAYLRPLPSALDMKVSIFAATIAAALIFSLNLLSDPERAPTGQISEILLVVGSVALVTSLCLAIMSLVARMQGDTKHIFSVISFAARKSAEETIEELRTKSPDDLTQNQLRHCHELAQIAMRKSSWFNFAAAAGIAGTILVALGAAISC